MLVIPGTPLLLCGVDHREPTAMQDFREALHRLLDHAQTWRVAIPGRQVPPLLSLGGLGIGIGVRVVRDGTEPVGHRGPLRGRSDDLGDREDVECVVSASDVLRGEDLAAEVRWLRAHRPAAAAEAHEIPIGVAVAVLVALEASRTVRLVPTGAGRAPLVADHAEPLIVPIDFSGAAHVDAPLEPRAGAVEFDDRLERALTGRVDTTLLRRLHGQADAAAACTEALAAVDLADARARIVAAVGVHHVRYRLIAVEPASVSPGAPGVRADRAARSAKQRA